MARFIVTDSSHFTPFTYDELVAPVKNVQAAQDKAQEVYDSFSTEAEALRNYISDDEGDTQAKALYDNYMNTLSELQNDLWDNGYTANTKRNLSLARKGYASDIARLSAAITARQASSKAYWDDVHKSPTSVFGSDPGKSGLDNYLADENFGNSYYSYDTDKFKEAVANDAKLRAQQIVTDPEYARIVNNPELPNVATRILQQGYTNGEVNLATAALPSVIDATPEERAAFYEANKIPEQVQWLTESFIDQYTATGAREADLSDESRERLISSGIGGWSYGIGAPDIKDFNLPKEKVETASSDAEDDIKSEKKPYSLGSSTTAVQSTDFAKLSGYTKRQSEYFKGKGFVPVIMPDGTMESVSDPFAAGQLIYNPPVRDAARKDLGGYDPAYSPRNWWGAERSQQKLEIDGVKYHTDGLSADAAKELNEEYGAKYGIEFKKGDTCIVKDGDRTYDVGLTISAISADRSYDAAVEAMKKANPDLDFDKFAMTPAIEKTLRDKWDIPNTVSSELVPYIAQTKEMSAEITPATIASSDAAFANYRTDLTNRIIDNVNKYNGTHGNKKNKNHNRMFFKVGEGGLAVNSRGTTDMLEVFGKKKQNDTVPNADGVSSYTVMPQDLLHTASDGSLEPRVRFTTPTGVWAVNADMLGNDVSEALSSIAPTIQVAYLPLSNPEKVVTWGEDAMTQWIRTLSNIGIELPVEKADGTMRHATPYDVVRSPELQELLISQIIDRINQVVSISRDNNQQNPMKHAGLTSHVEPYI